VTDADFVNRKFKICGVEFDMPYDTPYMIYNYAAAAAVARELGGISLEDAAKAFGSFKNVGGRFEILNFKGKTIKYMRIKQENPETLQTSINVMANDPETKDGGSRTLSTG
jgi:UDP-N-acetylmuramyl tripeptide synthase